MKTTTTYSPMTACRNPKVSARNVAEYLVVSNIMLPTNQPTNQPTNLYIYYILNLISSDGEICRQGASLAMRPAVSHPFPCLFSVLLILPPLLCHSDDRREEESREHKERKTPRR